MKLIDVTCPWIRGCPLPGNPPTARSHKRMANGDGQCLSVHLRATPQHVDALVTCSTIGWIETLPLEKCSVARTRVVAAETAKRHHADDWPCSTSARRAAADHTTIAPLGSSESTAIFWVTDPSAVLSTTASRLSCRLPVGGRVQEPVRRPGVLDARRTIVIEG